MSTNTGTGPSGILNKKALLTIAGTALPGIFNKKALSTNT
jgi:hypothetical protein